MGGPKVSVNLHGTNPQFMAHRTRNPKTVASSLKGGNALSLKEVLGSVEATAGSGRDLCAIDGIEPDSDVLTPTAGENGKASDDNSPTPHNNKKLVDGLAEYTGDNCLGVGEGDDE